VSDRLQVTLAMIELDFAQIHGAALRRDGPHHIGEIFEAKLCRLVDAVKASIDFHATILALNARLTGCARHQLSAAKIDLGGATAMAIIDRLRGMRDARGRLNTRSTLLRERSA